MASLCVPYFHRMFFIQLDPQKRLHSQQCSSRITREYLIAEQLMYFIIRHRKVARGLDRSLRNAHVCFVRVSKLRPSAGTTTDSSLKFVWLDEDGGYHHERDVDGSNLTQTTKKHTHS